MCVNSYNIDILKMEYTQASSKLQYLDDQANKYISYILAFIGALAGFLGLLMKDGMPTNYIAIALIISAGALIIGLLIIVTFHHTVQCFRLGGYIKFLESEINNYSNHSLLRWESHFTSRYIHKDITTFLIYFIMGIVFLGLMVGANYLSALYISSVWPLITVMIFFIGLLEIIVGVIYLIKAFSVHEKTYIIFAIQKQTVEHR